MTFCLSAGSLYAADAWKSGPVLPKDPLQLTLRGTATRPGNEYAGNAFQIVWPANVEKIDGQWILIGDKGGYSVPPVKGWVRKDDMLRVRDDGGGTQEDPPEFYSNKMVEAADSPALCGYYWLRGICWESQQESQIALQDYASAIRTAFGQRVDPTATSESVEGLFRPDQNPEAASAALARFPGLADAYLRLGRLTAKEGSPLPTRQPAVGKSSSGSGAPGAAAPWKTYFSCAEFLFRLQSPEAGPSLRVPKLDTDWADALTREFTSMSKANAAASKSKAANAPKNQGDVPRGDTTATTDASKEITDLAAPADSHYRNALVVNPSWSAGYLGRAKLLMAQADAMDRAQDVKAKRKAPGLLLTAIQQFTFSINLDPKSKEGYRGRAEAYHSLAKHQPKVDYDGRARYLSEAARSADVASQLGRDRDPASLELLAQVVQSYGDVYADRRSPTYSASFYKQAAYYWQEAAACPNADRGKLQMMLAECQKNGRKQQEYLAEAGRSLEGPAPEKELPLYLPSSNLFGEKNQD